MTHTKKRKRIKLPVIPMIVALMFMLGASIFLYPTVSNYLHEKNSSKITGEYAETVSRLDDETMMREMQKAVVYNEALAGDPVRDPFVAGSGMALPSNYLEVLNIDGIMCTIEIPKIHVDLPVYHGTSEAVLEKAVGHIKETALPIGGVGNHPVLTGHTGVAGAKLFTDLIKVKRGDIFIIRVLKETLYYEVDDISVILPEKISQLNPIEDKDCVTLVTCTPYGVNTHRLLVRGVRIEPSANEVAELMNTQRSLWNIIWEYKAVFIVVLFAIIWIVFWIFYLLHKRKKRKDKV